MATASHSINWPLHQLLADARSYYVSMMSRHRPLSAYDNPYPVGDANHDIWLAALITEAGDHLEVAAFAEPNWPIYG